MNEMDNSSFKRIRLPFPSSNILFILFNLCYLLRFRRGIFHISGHVHYAILALPAASTILTIHDLVFLKTYKGLRWRVMKWLFLDLPVRKAKWITTVSDKSKAEIIKYTQCEPNKIFVISNPLAENCSFNLNHTFAEEPCILFIGTKANKNLENVIPALYGIKIHLRIIGELTDKQVLLLEKFQLKYSSVFHISDDELSKEYQNADILLFPSLYEGFGLPVIEGFCAGKPVITSNISPMKEIANDAAFLVDPHSISSIRNAVIVAINDTTLRESKIEKGKLIARLYKSKNIFTQYEQLWKQVHESTRESAL
jgi:glycosyltransferase involved in cell wall biosynthesis